MANCGILCEIFSRKLLIELTLILKETTILPDEFIFKERDDKLK